MSVLVQMLLIYGGGGLVLLLLALLSSVIQAAIDRRRLQQFGPSGPDFTARARMKRLARPTLLLVPARRPGFSKLGGLPELPADAEWPTGDDGALAFVGQIDVPAFRRHGEFDWLPAEGRIYLFFDDQRNGSADSGRIIYSRVPAGPAVLIPPSLAKDRRFGERRVAFMRFTSFPSPDWLGRDWPDRLDWEAWPFASDADVGDEIEHRIGGYPSEIQDGQLGIECEYLHRGLTRDYREPVPDDIRRASWQWRLFLQIDSDEALNMNWWDAGRIYVFIRARDAKKGDFSKTVTITQTH